MSCDNDTFGNLTAARADLPDDTRTCVALYDRTADHSKDGFEPGRSHSQLHLAIEYTREEYAAALAVQNWIAALNNQHASSAMRDAAFQQACSAAFGLSLRSSEDILAPLFAAQDWETDLRRYNPAHYRGVVAATEKRLDRWLKQEAAYKHTADEPALDKKTAHRPAFRLNAF